jgi:hypothetical protein
MQKQSLRRVLVTLSFALTLAACRKTSQVTGENGPNEAAASGEPVAVGIDPAKPQGPVDLVKFFPAEGSINYKLKRQERHGGVVYGLMVGESEVGTMSLADVSRGSGMSMTERSRNSFANAKEKIAGQPLVDEGPQVSVLVNDKYLIQVERGTPSTMQYSELKEILAKFDIAGLAKL